MKARENRVEEFKKSGFRENDIAKDTGILHYWIVCAYVPASPTLHQPGQSFSDEPGLISRRLANSSGFSINLINLELQEPFQRGFSGLFFTGCKKRGLL